MARRVGAQKPDRWVLGALASPARLEIIAAIGHEAVTVETLAARLGRTRQALYHHLAALERAGLVEIAGHEGEGRERSRLYRLRSDRIAATARGSMGEREEARRAMRAILALTGRELDAAIREAPAGGAGPRLTRAKGRLSAGRLKRLHDLFAEIEALLAEPEEEGELYSVTLALTPSRLGGHRKQKE